MFFFEGRRNRGSVWILANLGSAVEKSVAQHDLLSGLSNYKCCLLHWPQILWEPSASWVLAFCRSPADNQFAETDYTNKTTVLEAELQEMMRSRGSNRLPSSCVKARISCMTLR